MNHSLTPVFFAATASNEATRRPTTALLTGASGGIGLDLARLFARDGYSLVLVARRHEILLRVAEELWQLGQGQINVTVISADLTDLEAPEQIFNTTHRAGIEVDILVNNAGFGARGAFVESDLDDDLDMIQLNIVTLVHLTRLYLPGMIARGASGVRGRILQVASTAAFIPGPLMAVYFATKAFVLSFSGALSEEMRGTNVVVTCFCPGATATGFAYRASILQSAKFKRRLMDSQTVAEIGYRGMMKGSPIVIAGLHNRIVVQCLRLAPRWLVRRAAMRIQT